MKAPHILLLGDNCRDIYYYGNVKRISPEAPVPVEADHINVMFDKIVKKVENINHEMESLFSNNVSVLTDSINDKLESLPKYVDNKMDVVIDYIITEVGSRVDTIVANMNSKILDINTKANNDEQCTIYNTCIKGF